jgi:high-affinity iron transporter
MVAVGVIFLRESIEASMIVSILLAFLDKIGRSDHYRDIWLGVGGALVFVSVGATAIYFTIRNYVGTTFQTVFETCTYLVAATLLTFMTFWMRKHARSMSSELRSKMEDATSRRQRFGLALIAFQAVGREGLETAIFTLAILFSTSSGGVIPNTHGAIWGALVGLGGGIGISLAIFRFGRRINLSKFFTVVGSLLMLFAAGLVADIIENMQQLGWISILNRPLWSTQGFMSQSSSLGDVFHSLLGYADHPTALQLGGYVIYLVVVISSLVLYGRRQIRASLGEHAPRERAIA